MTSSLQVSTNIKQLRLSSLLCLFHYGPAQGQGLSSNDTVISSRYVLLKLYQTVGRDRGKGNKPNSVVDNMAAGRK
jgi:hypothetical protein